MWVFRKLSDFWYDVKVGVYSLFRKMFKRKKEKKYRKNTVKIRDALFYVAMMAVPLIMFVLVNVYINGNAIIMAFQEYNGETKSYVFLQASEFFKHFQHWWNQIFHDIVFGEMLKTSLWVYVLSTVLCTFVPILFSYYVYKKLFGHRFFKIMLFLPSILSSIITVTMFKVFANEVIPEVYEKIFNKAMLPLVNNNPETSLSAIIFYNIWMGLGGGLLTQLAAMNTVDPSVAEAGQLDGVGFFGEFWHIVLPACYEVLTLGFVTGIAGIFTNSLNIYAFFGTGGQGQMGSGNVTIGYFITVQTLDAAELDYPQLSAWGVMITLIVTPVTLLLRHLINRFGPSEDSYERKKKKIA